MLNQTPLSHLVILRNSIVTVKSYFLPRIALSDITVNQHLTCSTTLRVIKYSCPPHIVQLRAVTPVKELLASETRNIYRSWFDRHIIKIRWAISFGYSASEMTQSLLNRRRILEWSCGIHRNIGGEFSWRLRQSRGLRHRGTKDFDDRRYHITSYTRDPQRTLLKYNIKSEVVKKPAIILALNPDYTPSALRLYDHNRSHTLRVGTLLIFRYYWLLRQSQ